MVADPRTASDPDPPATTGRVMDADDVDGPLDGFEPSLDVDADGGGDDSDADDGLLDVGKELDETAPEGGLDDVAGAADAFGPDELGDFDDPIDGADDETVAWDDEETDLLGGSEALADDGAEGTSDSPESAIDFALPGFDDDDDGDPAADAELELATALLPIEAHVVRSSAPWVLVEGAGARVPCSSVSVFDGTVLAAGEILVVVEPGALVARKAVTSLAVSAAAIADGLAVVATARGGVHAGPTLDALGGPMAVPRAPTRTGEGVDLRPGLGRVWMRRDDALYAVVPPGTVARERERGVAAIATSGGALLVLTSTPALELRGRDDEGWAPLPFPAEFAASKADDLLLAAGGSGASAALSDGSRIVVTRDRGAHYDAFAIPGVRALVFAGEGVDAPLVVALEADSDGESLFVRVDANGSTTRLARVVLGPAEADALDVAIHWDGSREVVWVASAAGLVALHDPRRH